MVRDLADRVEPTTNGSKPPQITNIQAARGAAAVLVVLFHATAVIGLQKYWGAFPLYNFFSFGNSGVEFFFVLSGFIIYSIHRSDISSNNPVARGVSFARKRFTRVYPIYWIALAAVVAAEAILGTGTRKTSQEILSNIFLINFHLPHLASSDTYLAVSWTLFHEVFFYAIFLICILNWKLGRVVLIFWATMCFLGIFLELPYIFESINILFLLGAIAAAIWTRRTVPHPRILLWGGLTTFLLLGIERSYVKLAPEDFSSLGFGLASAIIILGISQLERDGTLRSPPLLVLIGDASYSIYLLHFPLISVLAKILSRAPAIKSLPLEMHLACMVMLSVVTGVIFHKVMEKPLLRLFSRRARPREAVDPAA